VLTTKLLYFTSNCLPKVQWISFICWPNVMQWKNQQ